MSFTVEYHRRVYARLQRVAVASGRNSANQFLRELGGFTYGTHTPDGCILHIDARVTLHILPRLERYWGTRKGYRECPSN